jgi:hypothetical protein
MGGGSHPTIGDHEVELGKLRNQSPASAALRARHERPRCRRPAEQRDELASS